MIYHIYIISIPYRAKKNIYKIGKHKGDKDKLYRRYKNALINPKIYFFIEVNNYTLIESLVKKELDRYRIKFPDGNKSEWVNLELPKIIKCINSQLKYDTAKEKIIQKAREDNENPEKDYLLKNTVIPYPIVDHCYNILTTQGMHNDNNKCIDFIEVVKMIGCQKAHLKRLLIKHFEKNIDYSITTIKKKNMRGSGANYVENIDITLSCLKELLVVSHNLESKRIRKYLLQAEKVLKEYDNIIMSAFDDK